MKDYGVWKTLLSIIVPCYNCADYIEECLTSVLAYLPDNCELIIINDGSTDNSLNKIEKICQKHTKKQIKLLNQDNRGVSIARNAGINVCRGKYLTFLDADDYYQPAFWQVFPAILTNSDYDIFEFNASQRDKNGKQETLLKIVSFQHATVFRHLAERLPAFQNAQWFPWGRVYRTELFIRNDIRFPENCHYEDMYAIPQFYLFADSVCPVNETLIHYRTNDSSISQTFRKKDISVLIFILEKYKQIAKIKNNTKDIKMLLYPAVKRVFDLMKNLMIKNSFFNIAYLEKIRLQSALFYFSTEFPLRKKVTIYLLPLYFKLILSLRKK
ncbi:hypothetical protein BL250_15275 [Erwinia sp. OLTSP20]|uniref:glycosyltransferase family 2 protein n=1 Tax=Erwinia sp. OLTSP20 TaxID=1912857 RepID=UPI000C19084C|nr:glycosyltransferase [Erwinia sp. OLTSP20]PIJ89655.1 hypothetical protein BL250_15275 [Erwinia sp. OLTSP20]